jgi:hypothetical protein
LEKSKRKERIKIFGNERVYEIGTDKKYREEEK